jgi:hypothetical protein
MPKRQFLFSAVFGFRNLTQEIFSELDETKAHYLIFHGMFQNTEGESEAASRGPKPQDGAARPPCAPAYGEATPGSTDIAPSPIYSPRRENPKSSSHIPRRVL